jgi:hypothetical protein
VEAPSDYKNAGLANLIGGALNVLWGLSLTLGFLIMCIGVFWLIPVAMGGWQIMVGMNMYNGQSNASAKNATIAGIVASVLNFNIFSLAAGVYAYMMLGKPEVAGFLGVGQ